MQKKLRLLLFPLFLSGTLSLSACSIDDFLDLFYKETEKEIEVHEHVFLDWEVANPATQTSEGLKIRRCRGCEYYETEVIPQLPYTTTYNVENYYNGYYKNIISWTDSNDLKKQLHDVISADFNGLPYDGNWESNQYADQSLTDFTKDNVVYSALDDDKSNTYSNTRKSGWQREHAFCASLMTGYSTGEAVNLRNKKYSRATDFHNLFASYGKGNASRGNANFSILTDADKCQNDGDYRSKDIVFEPSDFDKGRVSRAIFYMGVMYCEDEASSISLSFNYSLNGSSKTKAVTVPAVYKGVTIVDKNVTFDRLSLTDFVSSSSSTAIQARSKYLTPYNKNYATGYIPTESVDETILSDFAKAYADYRYNEWDFSIGNLTNLLEWSKYPVDRLEYQHNESVYSHVYSGTKTAQNNRNPFIDYPELVDYVFGSKKDQPGVLSALEPTQSRLNLLSNELSNYALQSYKTTYSVGEKLTSSDYTIVRVNKNFTVQEMDFENTNQDYIFVSSDVGEKTITLSTPTGELKYNVSVTK